MQEYLCNDLAPILAPILLILTLINVAMILTAHKAENGSIEYNGDDSTDKLICAVFQCFHACQVERLIARQQEDIQHLSVQVAELCEWQDQLTCMMCTNEHVAERLLSVSMQQRHRIDMLRRMSGRAEGVLDGLLEKGRQQEEERKERAKRERVEKRKAGIWEVSGRQLRRVGREEELRVGRDQERVEEEVGTSGERCFELVEGNSKDFGNFAAREMEKSQIFQRDRVHPAQSELSPPFVNGLYDPNRAKTKQGRNRWVFGRPIGSRDEAPGQSVLQEPLILAAHAGKFQNPTAIRWEV